MLSDPPQYDFVLVAYRYDYQHPRSYHLSFDVENGQLTGQLTPNNDGNEYQNRQIAAIFRYFTVTNSFEEIVFDEW